MQVVEALELLSSMKEKKFPLTAENFNIIISAYVKSGKVRKAFKFYNDVSHLELVVMTQHIIYCIHKVSC